MEGGDSQFLRSGTVVELRMIRPGRTGARGQRKRSEALLRQRRCERVSMDRQAPFAVILGHVMWFRRRLVGTRAKLAGHTWFRMHVRAPFCSRSAAAATLSAEACNGVQPS